MQHRFTQSGLHPRQIQPAQRHDHSLATAPLWYTRGERAEHHHFENEPRELPNSQCRPRSGHPIDSRHQPRLG